MSAADSAQPDVPGLADDGLASWVAEVRRSPGPPNRVAGARALREASAQRAAARPSGPELPLVVDMTVDAALPVRLYRAAAEPRPLALYLHGGGFVIGDLDSHDSICRRLALLADVNVLAVGYRRAPEHPGPAAVEDAVRAFRWASAQPDDLGSLAEHGIGLAGDSAGGAIAVLAAVKLVQQAQPPAALMLANPNADMTLTEPSVEDKGHGWGLEADDLRWFVEQWIPDPQRRAEPDLSPVHANLAGLPATLIATVQHDPLRDEGRRLAQLMLAAGVEVWQMPLAGLVHGFLSLGNVSPSAKRAGDELFCRFGFLLRRAAAMTAAAS